MPLHYFAALGLSGMPVVLATYGLLSLLAVPLLYKQRAGWRPQWRDLLAIGLFGGWATAGLVGALVWGLRHVVSGWFPLDLVRLSVETPVLIVAWLVLIKLLRHPLSADADTVISHIRARFAHLEDRHERK